MMRRHGLFAAAFTALAAACGGTDAENGSPAGPLRLASTDVHVLGSSPAIAVVRDLDVAPDGSVWLLNSVEPLFVGFDSTGATIGAHGTPGGGPEEFRLPVGFTSGGFGGETWVVDFIRHSLIRVSSPHDPWEELRLPRDSVPPGSLMGGMDLLIPHLRAELLDGGVILPRTDRSEEAGIVSLRLAALRADLMSFDPDEGTARRVVSLDEVLEDPRPSFVATDGGFPLWYRLWTVCGDEIRVYDRVRNELRGFDRGGMEIDPVALPPTFDEVTPTEFARAIFTIRQAEVMGEVGPRMSAGDSIRMIREIADRVEGSPRELAAYLPRFVDLDCADDGTIWIRPLDLDVGGMNGGPVWIRISPGLAGQDVHLPPRFDAFRFTADRIWGVQRDELDVASVAWIDVP